MIAKRGTFMGAVRSKLGAIVVWAHKGPDTFDCSGLVTWALMHAGGDDVRDTHNANRLWYLLPPIASPAIGDLAFWSSTSVGQMSHVAIVTGVSADGDTINGVPIISADGATPSFTLEMATASTHCRVREHSSIAVTGRQYFRGFRRNTLVED